MFQIPKKNDIWTRETKYHSPEAKAKRTISFYIISCRTRGIAIIRKPFPKSYWLLYHFLTSLFEKDLFSQGKVENKIKEFMNRGKVRADFFEIIELIKNEMINEN